MSPDNATSSYYDAAKKIYEILTPDIHWRATGSARERKLSDKILRWLFACFSEPVDTEFSLGSEYAELEDRSRQSALELPVFAQINNPDPVIIFGAEGMGKTTSALWLMEQYIKSTKADVFPVYAPYEAGVKLKDWIVGTITRALINFIADNPQKFITSPDSRKTAMVRLMLWHARNVETLRFNLSSSSADNTTDIEQVIDYIRKFKQPKSIAKMSRDEMLSSLYLAYPAGFAQLCFIWDIPASSPHQDVINQIKEMASLVMSLTRQNMIVKIFAPVSAKEDVADHLGGIRHAGDLIWDEDRLQQLLNRKMNDKFETLWDRSVDNPSGMLVKAADHSPRCLVKLLLRLMDYVDEQPTQDGEMLKKSDFKQMLSVPTGKK